MRLLYSVAAFMLLGANKNEHPFAYENDDENVCQQVDANMDDTTDNRKMCRNYLDLPLITQESCDGGDSIPKVYYSVSKDNEQSLPQVGVSASNPDFERRHFGDDEALVFIQENCGEDAASAYQCLAPPAYRADLFRFCAIHSQGGIYLDSDILPLVPFEELYDPCSIATVGHDWPQGRPQKQMKILAGQQGAPIFKCMIDKIVDNVRSRFYPDNPLALTGPMVLHECYEEHSEGVSVTYRDTRNAIFPYAGMRGGDDDMLLAYEIPSHSKNYAIDFEEREVYRPTCSLHVDNNEPVVFASM